MRELDAALPRADGVRWFNRLYLDVTEGVRNGLAHARFEDARFTDRLDVVFAGQYFSALERPPSAWRPLLEARSRTGVAPLQFALAGMNAHINRDLPVALVATRRELGVDLEPGGPRHRDFLLVNTLLAEAEERAKAAFATGVVGWLDRLLGRIDDVLALWNIARARDAAWTNAGTLWALRDSPVLRDEFLETLDHTVGFAGRGLLRPARPWLLRGLARLLGR